MTFGNQIIFSMLIQFITPHIPGTLFFLVFKLRKCCDRGCTKDDKKTKQTCQEDYEGIHLGWTFLLDLRLAQIVACMYVTFMFSSTMPFLYVVMILNFGFTYWVDKWLLLRFYRTPINYDSTSTKFAVWMMNYAIIFHFVIGYFMLGNRNIISTQPVSVLQKMSMQLSESTNYWEYDGEQDKFSEAHIGLGFFGFAIIMGLWIFDWVTDLPLLQIFIQAWKTRKGAVI